MGPNGHFQAHELPGEGPGEGVLGLLAPEQLPEPLVLRRARPVPAGGQALVLVLPWVPDRAAVPCTLPDAVTVFEALQNAVAPSIGTVLCSYRQEGRKSVGDGAAGQRSLHLRRGFDDHPAVGKPAVGAAGACGPRFICSWVGHVCGARQGSGGRRDDEPPEHGDIWRALGSVQVRADPRTGVELSVKRIGYELNRGSRVCQAPKPIG